MPGLSLKLDLMFPSTRHTANNLGAAPPQFPYGFVSHFCSFTAQAQDPARKRACLLANSLKRQPLGYTFGYVLSNSGVTHRSKFINRDQWILESLFYLLFSKYGNSCSSFSFTASCDMLEANPTTVLNCVVRFLLLIVAISLEVGIHAWPPIILRKSLCLSNITLQ